MKCHSCHWPFYQCTIYTKFVCSARNHASLLTIEATHHQSIRESLSPRMKLLASRRHVSRCLHVSIRILGHLLRAGGGRAAVQLPIPPQQMSKTRIAVLSSTRLAVKVDPRRPPWSRLITCTASWIRPPTVTFPPSRPPTGVPGSSRCLSL